MDDAMTCTECSEVTGVCDKHTPKDVPRLTEPAIQTIVNGLVNQQVYCSQWIPAELLTTCFLTLGLDGPSGYNTDQIGEIIAYRRDALGRGVNGYPIFLGHQFIHTDDWEIIRGRYNKVLEVTEKVIRGE